MSRQAQSLMVIIPAYNEEGSVGDVVRSVRQVLPETPVVVIDDGSVDSTPQVARQAGAELLRLPHHLGLGGAVQTGYRFAFEHGYDCVVRVDSDGQHNAADIPKLLEKLRADSFDMVTGSRFLESNGYQVQWLRRIGGLLFSAVLYPILGKRITDPTSGFAAVNRRALEVFSRSFPLEYPEIEALVVLQRKRLRFCEVPVQMFARRAGRSTIGSMQAIYYMFRVLLGVLVNVLKYERRFHIGRRG
ncbi:MAG: glycosyltransferase family 2 protein [Acidobacteria bacterium]|nr:glycosyltransferase family 2 protein [Acidobacteriota bacterium]